MSDHTLGRNITIQPTVFPGAARNRVLDRTRKLRSSKYPFVQISLCELFYHVSVPLFYAFLGRYSLASADATCKREHREDQIIMRAFRLLSTGSGQRDPSIRSFILHMGRRGKALFYHYRGVNLGCYYKPLCRAIASSRPLFGSNSMGRCYLHRPKQLRRAETTSSAYGEDL
jgi:hypothetical protein